MRRIIYLLTFLVLSASLASAAPKRTSTGNSAGNNKKTVTKKTATNKATQKRSKKSRQPKAEPVAAGPRPYQLIDAKTCASVEGSADRSEYRCIEETDRFLANEQVNFWAKLANVRTGYQYQIKTYREGKLVRQSKSAWNRQRDRSVSSFLVAKEANTVPGNYRSDFFINTGKGFERIASRDYVVEVLSPVDGYVRNQCVWPVDDDTWAFCEHIKTGRRSSRGIALANDNAALDINLREYEDAGKPVYPVAPGTVVRYGDQYEPGQGAFAGVLIEHETPDGQKWWSGYLHMRRDSIRLHVGQAVDVDDTIGRVGATGTSNSHLHLVVYRGENRLGALRSFAADFRARTNAELRRVARQRALNDDQG